MNDKNIGQSQIGTTMQLWGCFLVKVGEAADLKQQQERQKQEDLKKNYFFFLEKADSVQLSVLLGSLRPWLNWLLREGGWRDRKNEILSQIFRLGKFWIWFCKFHAGFLFFLQKFQQFFSRICKSFRDGASSVVNNKRFFACRLDKGKGTNIKRDSTIHTSEFW